MGIWKVSYVIFEPIEGGLESDFTCELREDEYEVSGLRIEESVYHKLFISQNFDYKPSQEELDNIKSVMKKKLISHLSKKTNIISSQCNVGINFILGDD